MSYLFMHLPLCIPLFVIGVAIFEIYEEKKFKKIAQPTEGTIIGSVKGKFADRDIGYGRHALIINGNIVNGFLLVEFETDKGEVYSVRTKKIYPNYPHRNIPVSYNPNDPTDVMIDSFYKSGISKYFRFVGGLIFLAGTYVGVQAMIESLAGQ